jgi:YfiH family protein
MIPQTLHSTLLRSLPGVSHAFFTREGGSSIRPFESLNCSYWVGDDPRLVQLNLNTITQVCGVQSLHYTRQVHGTKIVCVDGAVQSFVGEGDGMFSREPGRAVMVLHADCQPILIADPNRRAVCAVHAGWRGLMKGVLVDALHELQRIGCQMRDCAMAIGPSLGPQSAEFKHYREEFPEWLWPFRLANDRFDLWQIAVMQARECGIPLSQIDVLGIDTYVDPRFFSYRRLPCTGRNGSLIWLCEDMTTQ